MAYHHFDDVQEAARFGDSAFGTSFQSNPQYHDEPTR